jgi:hypothetical protein
MKPRGRPRVDATDRSVDVHFKLPAKHYDQTCAQARRARLTLSEWIRRSLRPANYRGPKIDKP